MELSVPSFPTMPTFSGDAGIGALVQTMREPAYLKLLGKCMGTGIGTGLLLRRLPPQFALPVALVAGMYLGLEMAAWMEEDAKAKRLGPVIDVTPEPTPAAVEAEDAD